MNDKFLKERLEARYYPHKFEVIYTESFFNIYPIGAFKFACLFPECYFTEDEITGAFQFCIDELDNMDKIY